MPDFDFQPVEAKPTKTGSGYASIFDLSKVKLWTMPDGNNTVRLLPPNVGQSPSWGIPVAYHYGVPLPESEEKRTFLCLREMRGHRNCPACSIFFDLHKQDKNHPLKGTYKTNKKVLCRVIVRGDDEETPVLWQMPKGINDHLNMVLDKGGRERFDHPFEGADIEIVRKGKGLNTTYTVLEIGQPGPVHSNEQTAEKVLNAVKATTLGSLLLMMDADEEKALKAAFDTEGADGDEEDNDQSGRFDF